MSHTENDSISESRAEYLGLSSADFQQFLVGEGYVTRMEVAANPAILAELMSDDSLWSEYEDMAEARAEAQESDKQYRYL